MVMGTAGYMSPEQVRGKAVDHRTDIFSFGAIVYEMLTGTRAFHRSTSAETMTAILNDDPPAISQRVQTAPPGLQRVVHRCLEKNPEQRFHSASDLAFALEALSESGSVPATAVSGAPGQRRRSKVLVWSGSVVAFLTLTAAAYLVVASRNSVPPLRVSAYTHSHTLFILQRNFH
jgi:serine/threonine protein kinase